MRRTLVALVAALPLAIAAPAVAAPPLEYLPNEPATTDLPLCGTLVTIDDEVQREKTNTKTGRTTGALKIRVTNQLTGKSILVNASGPGTFTPSVDEAGVTTLVFDFTGRSLIYPFVPEEIPLFRAAGLPDIFATNGPVVGTVVIGADGVVRSSTFDVPRNRIQDLCDRIT